MVEYRLRTDLKRDVVDGFAFPLGIRPMTLAAPNVGYTIAFNPAEDEVPDTYSFHIVVSHERVAEVLRQLFTLLPSKIFAVVEVSSYDAYRPIDVFISSDPVSREQFLQTWQAYEPLLLEDGLLAAGATSEEPFIEIFLDQWKGVSLHVPPALQETVESMLQQLGLEEQIETWPDDEDSHEDQAEVRQVLDLPDEFSPDLDQVLLDLRHHWNLLLDIDPESNVDEAGRNLGLTLWHVILIVRAVDRTDRGAYLSAWVTAGSMNDMLDQVQQALDTEGCWLPVEVFTVERVAFDERPDELADIDPRRTERKVHRMELDEWETPSAEAS